MDWVVNNPNNRIMCVAYCMQGQWYPVQMQSNPSGGAVPRGQVKSDWVGLINEWAGRFFQELDYEREAASAAVFAAQMADLPGITVPDVLPALTSHTVLTSAWVAGAPWARP